MSRINEHELHLTESARKGAHEVLVDAQAHPNHAVRTFPRKCVVISDPNFIPITNFTTHNLPFGYRSDELFQFIKVWAELTVKLEDSEIRHNSLAPYRSRPLRTTPTMCTGIVYKVEMHTIGTGDKTTCPCPAVIHQGSEKLVWWKVYVRTTKDLLEYVDPIKLKCTTTIDLRDDIIPMMSTVVLNGVNAVSKIKGHGCILEFATHNMEVGYKLRELCTQFDELHKRVYEKYNNNKDVNLTLIISYSQGVRDKAISIGHWVDCATTEGRTWYVYTTATSPGSAGALVYRVGHRQCDDVHVGVTQHGLNFSG